MKNFIIMLTLFSFLFGKSQTEAKSIYSESFKLKMIDGSDLDLSTLKGKYILFVNVASECGFTPQYQGLQKLSEDYKENLKVSLRSPYLIECFPQKNPYLIIT